MKHKSETKKRILPSIPHFKNEDEERDFWANHSITDYLHIFKPVKLDFSKLKYSKHKGEIK